MTNRSDDYDRADDMAGALGTPSDGLGGYTVIGTWVTDGTTARNANGATLAPAALQSDVSDVTVQVTLATAPGNSNAGISLRYSDANNFIVLRAGVWGEISFAKNEAGSFSQIEPAYTHTNADGDILKVVANGTTLTAYLNGSVIIGPLTESFNSTATKHGLYAHSETVARFDNLTVVGPAAPPATQTAPIAWWVF